MPKRTEHAGVPRFSLDEAREQRGHRQRADVSRVNPAEKRFRHQTNRRAPEPSQEEGGYRLVLCLRAGASRHDGLHREPGSRER